MSIKDEPVNATAQHTNQDNNKFNPQSNKLCWILVISLIFVTKEYGYPPGDPREDLIVKLKLMT